MPRLPVPSDSDDFSDETRSRPPHPRVPRQPAAAEHLPDLRGDAGALLSDLVEHLRHHTTLTDAETELAICTSARASNADYIWNAHVRLGLAAGTREEAIDAVDKHAPLDGLTADEALIIRFGRELLESPTVSQETFDAVSARWGVHGLFELLAVMSVYTFNANILRATGLPGSAGRAAPDALGRSHVRSRLTPACTCGKCSAEGRAKQLGGARRLVAPIASPALLR